MKKRQGYRVALLFIVIVWLPVSIFAEERPLDTSNLPSIGLPPQPKDSVVKTREKEEKAQLKKKRDEADARARSAVDSLKKALMEKKQPASISTYIDPETGMEFVYVKGGCYQMGDTFGDGRSNEKEHEVCVLDYWLGKYEVTQGEWEKVMGSGSNPSAFGETHRPRYPVENVSWKNAQEFIEKLNKQSGKQYRLPTEAEWEYAAREGGKKVRFGTGKDTIGADEANFDALAKYKAPYSRTGEYRGSTLAVGSFAPNGLGLYDMSGNVWEWCSDRYDSNYYASSPRNNPQGPSSGAGRLVDEERVIRGGGYLDYPEGVRAARRFSRMPPNYSCDLGFRLVLPPDH